MAAKNNTEVIIDGKVYTLSGYESQEYLQKVATYINDKIAEFKMLDEYKRIPSDMRSTLLALNIADDYFKAKNQVEKLEQDLEVKDREIYDLKHELISNQIRMESDAKSLKDLEKENKELLLNKTRLEATLEDALLGKVDKLEKPEKTEKPEEKKAVHTEEKKEEKKEEKTTDFVVSKNYNKKYEIIITMPQDFTTIYTPADGVKVTGEIVNDSFIRYSFENKEADTKKIATVEANADATADEVAETFNKGEEDESKLYKPYQVGNYTGVNKISDYSYDDYVTYNMYFNLDRDGFKGTIKVVVQKLKAEADDSDTEAIITAILDNVKVEKKKCE